MAKRVTFTKGVTEGDTTEYGVLLDGVQVGTVERSRETDVVCYTGVNYGRDVTRTEWWARGFFTTAEGKTKHYGSGYGRTTRKDAVTGLIAAVLRITTNEARGIVDAR